MKRLAPLAVLGALLACGQKKNTDAPWLTMPDAATHSARVFPVNAGNAHGPSTGQQQLTTCNCCHADRSAAPLPAGSQCHYPPAASFKTYTCTGCHVVVGSTGISHDDIAGLATLPEHAGQAAFDPTQPLAFDQACVGCHPEGAGAPPVYHGQLFPIDSASKHAGIGCSSCHGIGLRSNLANLQCAQCHAANFPTQHSTVNGVAILVVLTPPPPANCTPSALPPLTSPDCLKCHALSAPIPVSAHPTTNSTFGTGRHEGAGCFTCHLATTQVTATVSPPTPAPSGYPTIDFTQPANPSRTSTPGCTTCHSYGCGGN